MSVGLNRVLSHKYHQGYKPLMVLCFQGIISGALALPLSLFKTLSLIDYKYMKLRSFWKKFKALPVITEFRPTYLNEIQITKKLEVINLCSRRIDQSHVENLFVSI